MTRTVLIAMLHMLLRLPLTVPPFVMRTGGWTLMVGAMRCLVAPALPPTLPQRQDPGFVNLSTLIGLVVTMRSLLTLMRGECVPELMALPLPTQTMTMVRL